MKNSLLISILLFLTSCSNTTILEELEKTKEELIAAKATIKNLKTQTKPEGKLVHILFFKIKPNVDIAALTTEINTLKKIDAIKYLKYGFFEDIGDERALSDYAMMLEMSFDNEAAYRKYQKHPVHLALKESVSQFLGGPPVTYDYIKE